MLLMFIKLILVEMRDTFNTTACIFYENIQIKLFNVQLCTISVTNQALFFSILNLIIVARTKIHDTIRH